MKSKLLLSFWFGLLAIEAMPTGVAAQAQGPKPAGYTVIDLCELSGGDFSQATFVSNNGLITGLSNAVPGGPLQPQHAILWAGGQPIDISSPGFGGPNSFALGITPGGRVAGIATRRQ